MTAVILELYMRKFLSFSRAEFIRSAGNTRIERKEKKRKRNRKGFTIMLKNKSLCLISKSKKWLSFNVILVLTITGAVLQVTCNYSNIAIQRFAVVVVVCLFCFVLFWCCLGEYFKVFPEKETAMPTRQYKILIELERKKGHWVYSEIPTSLLSKYQTQSWHKDFSTSQSN